MAEWDVVQEKPAAAASGPAPMGKMEILGQIAKQVGKNVSNMATGAIEGPKQMVDRAKMYGRADYRDVDESMIKPSLETAATFSPMSAGSQVAKSAAKSLAPSQEALYKAAKEGYETIKKSDIPIPAVGLKNLYETVKGKLIDENHRDYLAEGTFKAIKELLEPVGGRPGLATVGDVEGVRQVLNNIKPGTSDSVAAGIAKREIDKFLDNIPDIADVLKAARGNYGAAKRSELVTKGEEKAERGAAVTGSGANITNKLRQSVNKILNDPSLTRGMSKDELAMMDDIARGGKVENVARLVSKLGPNHPVSGWLTAISADLAGGAGLGTATLGVGALAHEASKRMTEKKIGKLDETIRARSPLGGNITPEKAAASIKAFMESSPVLMGLLRSLSTPSQANNPTNPYLRSKGM